MGNYLGIDCGSVSLNLVLFQKGSGRDVSVYLRTQGRPLQTLIAALDSLRETCRGEVALENVLVTGSGRELLAGCLGISAINEISAHGNGVWRVDPRVRTVIEIGGQDSKFIRIEPSRNGDSLTFPVFRMNEICAAGTGAFLDEQATRLGIPIESFGEMALKSRNPAPIAGRCAVFAKTDMIHKAQEGAPIPDILMGLALALVRNYISGLIRGEPLVPVVSLQGGVMLNQSVVQAFQRMLELEEDQITRPQHFTVLGALGCARLAVQRPPTESLTVASLRERAVRALNRTSSSSFLPPLDPKLNRKAPSLELRGRPDAPLPLVMGIDVGSVSVKGVLIDGCGRILKEDYRLSRSLPLETMTTVMEALLEGETEPALFAVTGSGRYLAGRLLNADLIVNEISAQARAALSHDPGTETIVEIGGQDSKWISLERGELKDFEMNRVCAAGTGSFLMEQADRLGLDLGEEFSGAAFSARRPSDLGTRCTVFMESDLIHHQNNGATSADLAAGVCLSIVHNYLEKVANNKPIGEKVLFLGGVAATPAVKAAFEQQTNRSLQLPPFFKVSGALGAALKALDTFKAAELQPRERTRSRFDPASVRKEQFRCKGCENQCVIDKYRPDNRLVFHGGLCDRWEGERGSDGDRDGDNAFETRVKLLEELARGTRGEGERWGVVRSPLFYEWFPFWRGFCEELGISLVPAPRSNRAQFERGCRNVKVETCLPMKVPAGQISDLMDMGLTTIFHPSMQNEAPVNPESIPQIHCPYVQASSQFFKGSYDVQWKETFASWELEPDSVRREHVRFAMKEGFSRRRAAQAVERGMENQGRFHDRIGKLGQDYLDRTGPGETAFVVLGKPYHTSDSFLNMNLAGLFRRLGVKAMPGDLYPLRPDGAKRGVRWKYQGNIVQTAAEIAQDPRLFPLVITFFGCGPDPFTLRHIKEALGPKPVLLLEMDEHTSRAGVLTRVEAFLERIKSFRQQSETRKAIGVPAGQSSQPVEAALSPGGHDAPESLRHEGRRGRVMKPSSPTTLYTPYMGLSSYGFAAAARSVGVEAHVLPEPDDESERLGSPHLVGGECYPYALVVGDYLKLARSVPEHQARRSLYYVLGQDACRLGQYPVYLEKVRRQLGYGMGVIGDVDEGLKAFGLSTGNRGRLLIRAWEGLNAYDLLDRLFYRLRPLTRDKQRLEEVHIIARDKLFAGLCEGRIRQGMEEALHELAQIPADDEVGDRPVVAVTGDYYTRVVPFANHEIYQEVEHLGGLIWTPPTFSDSFKMDSLKQFIWTVLSRRGRDAAGKGLFYLFMTAAEFKVKGGKLARKTLNAPLDLSGRRMWKSTIPNADPRLPAGITAPVVTALQDVDSGADGVLNLITLNCLYGTVVTAVLSRALKKRGRVPMLTLIYEGLKKTNEKTRLEAFMDQVHERYREKNTSRV